MIKAVLFDFDGVLTLDETGSQAICRYICSVTGISEQLFREAYRKYNPELLTGKLKHEDIWDEICAEVGRDIELHVLHDSFANTPINPEMLRLVKEIKQRGYKVGMITDNKADRINVIMEHHKWSGLFDAVSVSAEIGSGKDEEHIFLKTFQELEVKPEECVFIDNSRKNLVVPGSLGVVTILFDHGKNDVAALRKNLSRLGVGVNIKGYINDHTGN